MAILVGRVAAVGGEALAQSRESGEKRVLKVGDPVFEGDVIVAASGVEVELVFERGDKFLVRENETVTLDEHVFVIAGWVPEARLESLVAGVRRAWKSMTSVAAVG